MNREGKIQKIKACIAIAVLVILIGLVGTSMIKYQVEGETNMPFIVKQLTVYSSAEGVQTEEATTNWSLNLVQNNDIYFEIEKNAAYTEEATIQNITIDNLQIEKAPKVGNIVYYMPQSEAGEVFAYKEKYALQDALHFKGASKTNIKNLEIGNQGGAIAFRVSNQNIGQFLSDADDVITHNGTILTKANVTPEELECKISFDFSIQVRKTTYKSHITLELPVGNIMQEGTCRIEKTDIVFKRDA